MSQEGHGTEVEQIIGAWARERPGADVSSIGIVTPIRRLSTALVQARASALHAFELDESRLEVLGTLRRAGAPYRLTSGELSRRCRVTAGATTQRVDRLERDGFVRRVRDETDRRTTYVELTADGTDKLDEVFDAVIDADERVLSSLEPRDRAELEGVLGRWLRSAGLDRWS